LKERPSLRERMIPPPGESLLEQLDILSVAFLSQVLLGDEAQGGRVHAVAQPCRRRPVIKDMPEMRIGMLAPDLCPCREKAPVLLLHDITRLQRLGEARPARARIILVLGAE